ncbi:MepB family protein [Vicingaceae bacterium]|nr:MepB family protein [Vicingaceae bacterium]MDB4062060.1 MepB family protein [Vicingaceae bacterium]
MNEPRVIYRSSRITPKKIGQFVSVWKRNNAGITEPQHVNDDFDHFVIQCEKGNDVGQFVFPKSILVKTVLFLPPKNKENEVLESTLLEIKLKINKLLKLRNGNWNTFILAGAAFSIAFPHLLFFDKLTIALKIHKFTLHLKYII